LGRRLGLIAIHPAFIAHHADQVARYGLGARVVGIRSMNASIAEHMAAFADPIPRAVLRASFETQARILLDAGADVIVPTGGIPMMMFGAERGAHIDGAPVVDGVAVIVKAAEMAVKLRAISGLGPSRALHSGQALPSPAVVEEFLSHG
jgi:Asp/Glu/hydantoin racemase